MNFTSWESRPRTRRVFALWIVVALGAAPLHAEPLDDVLVSRSGFETLPCTGVGCFQVDCPPGQNTSVSGVAYAPNGTLPLPNVTIYVPTLPVPSFPAGPTCNRCGEMLASAPVARAYSNADGSFTLNNVPATSNVPIVFELGKWRRQIVLPSVPACANVALTAAQSRLPGSQAEGELPRIALSTGGADALECLLRKAGVADLEFSSGTGTGRVHLYAGSGGTDRLDFALGGQVLGASTSLWASSASLAAYDVVALSCEGGQFPNTKPPTALAAMKAYADASGRVFASHWHNYWIQSGPAPWPTLVTWQFLANLGSQVHQVNLSLPRARTFSEWLTASGATSTPGTLTIADTRHTAIGVDSSRVRAWLGKTTTTNGQPTVQYLSYATPTTSTPQQTCGRVTFADMHANSGDISVAGLSFPSGGCTTPIGTLNPTEKAVLYALLDLQRCTGNDGD